MPRSTIWLFAAAFPAALGLPGPDALLAQGHPGSRAPEEIRHIQSMSPRSGPPGTLVSISTLNLPYEARVHVGVGALGLGFEALTEAEQGRLGEIAVRVEVPANVSWDRPIVFVAFNAIFAPIGMSDPFHVTDEEGRVRREGVVVSTDDECVLFRDRDGYEYELTGETGALVPGQEVRLEGVFFEAGACLGMPVIGVPSNRP